MCGAEALQSVQFVTANGRRLAVLSRDDWESLIGWLETLEDAQSVRAALEELKSAGGNRQKAGWIEWSSVEHELA